MVLKTFNIEEDVFSKFSKLCKDNGISMSKQIQFFMESVVETDPVVKKEYLERLDRLRAGNFVKVKSFTERYV